MMPSRHLLLAALALCACQPPPGPCRPKPGQMCAVAGTGFAGLATEGAPATEAPLYLPQDMTVGPDGRLYILDWNNHRVRVLNEEGTMHTLIGTGELGDAPEGPALQTGLNHPTHVAFAPDGRLVLSAWHNSKVMAMELSGALLQTVAGTGKRAYGGDGGRATLAALDLPAATAFAPDGSMYIADQANQCIRKVGTDGLIHTAVGRCTTPGFSGDGGPATQALLQAPQGQAASPSGKIATDAAGNLYIADSGNHRVRKVSPEGTITTIAGSGERGETAPFGDGGPATEAQLSRPTDVAVGPDGSLFIADTDHSCVRRVSPLGIISTVAGRCGEPGEGGNGMATEQHLRRPFGLEVDGSGRLYVADTFNHLVRVVYP
jgi:DNA-binding beta-propeller fold protein YncE